MWHGIVGHAWLCLARTSQGEVSGMATTGIANDYLQQTSIGMQHLRKQSAASSWTRRRPSARPSASAGRPPGARLSGSQIRPRGFPGEKETSDSTLRFRSKKTWDPNRKRFPSSTIENFNRKPSTRTSREARKRRGATQRKQGSAQRRQHGGRSSGAFSVFCSCPISARGNPGSMGRFSLPKCAAQQYRLRENGCPFREGAGVRRKAKPCSPQHAP